MLAFNALSACRQEPSLLDVALNRVEKNCLANSSETDSKRPFDESPFVIRVRATSAPSVAPDHRGSNRYPRLNPGDRWEGTHETEAARD